jgi:hypothetical protein
MQVRSVLPGRTVAGCLLLTLALGACGKSDTTSSVRPQPQRMNVTARDFALKIAGSSALRPGPVTITARNMGKEAHGLVLAKLNDGVDTAALVKALTTAPGKVGDMISYVGGTTALPRGGSWEGTTSFDPGSYAMLDVGTATSGRLNVTRSGEVQGFTVQGKAVQAASARADAEVSLYDYGIDVPRVIPAGGRIRVNNTGEDDHQLIVQPVANAAEAKRLIAGIRSGKPTGLHTRPVEVLAPTSSATSTTVRYGFRKGAYVAYCLLVSAKSNGQPHARLGMVAAFAVAGS